MANIALPISALAIGVLLAIAGAIVGWVVVPNIIDDKIKEETRLVEGSETWDKWQEVPYPMTLSFYIFNITNPEAIGTNEKIVLEEFGPYVYDQKRVKENITIDDEEDTVTYVEVKRYYFNAEASAGSEDDAFTVPNIPLISVGHVAMATMDNLTPAKAVINLLTLIAKEKLYRTNTTVKELLFDGWKLPGQYNLLAAQDAFPEAFEGLLFGLYRNKNGSSDGEYVVKRGIQDHTEFGKIVEWDGKKELEWWYTSRLDVNSSMHYCNKINGSDGSLYPPFVTKDTVLRIFNTDVCRSIHLTYDSDVVVEDIPAYKFTIPFEMVAHPVCNKDNACFCTKQSDKVAHHCGQSVIRIYGCQEGAPIVTSNARFLDGGDDLFEAVEIPPANRTEHETYIVVEPDSGLLLKASKKIQIGVELQNFPEFKLFQDLDFSGLTDSPSIILPIMWAEEYVEIDRTSAEEFYDKLINPKRIVDIVKWVVVGFGIAISLGSIVMIQRNYAGK